MHHSQTFIYALNQSTTTVYVGSGIPIVIFLN
jgi:hypothetical protein